MYSYIAPTHARACDIPLSENHPCLGNKGRGGIVSQGFQQIGNGQQLFNFTVWKGKSLASTVYVLSNFSHSILYSCQSVWCILGPVFCLRDLGQYSVSVIKVRGQSEPRWIFVIHTVLSWDFFLPLSIQASRNVFALRNKKKKAAIM